MAFTGRLLIGADVIPNPPYLNMGFSPAWLYEQVYDLTLRAGELLTAQVQQRHSAEVTIQAPRASLTA